MKNNYFKKCLLSLFVISGLTTTNVFADGASTGFFSLFSKEDKSQDSDYNNIKSSIVQYIEEFGVNVTEDIRDTENLKLDSEKILIEGKDKILLIKVTNKTGSTINVNEEVGFGTPYPEKLSPHNTGYLIVANFDFEPTIKYDIKSYNNLIVHNLISNETPSISKFFHDNLKIYEVGNLNVIEKDRDSWITEKINEHKLFLVSRVDRVVDDNSFRYGLFVSGFVKVNDFFYKPISYYFITYEGKIVKMFYVNEYLEFKDFKQVVFNSSFVTNK